MSGHTGASSKSASCRIRSRRKASRPHQCVWGDSPKRVARKGRPLALGETAPTRGKKRKAWSGKRKRKRSATGTRLGTLFVD